MDEIKHSSVFKALQHAISNPITKCGKSTSMGNPIWYKHKVFENGKRLPTDVVVMNLCDENIQIYRLKCCNETHFIELACNDNTIKLTLWNHPEYQVESEFIIETLGGEACRCIKLYKSYANLIDYMHSTMAEVNLSESYDWIKNMIQADLRAIRKDKKDFCDFSNNTILDGLFSLSRQLVKESLSEIAS